MHSERPLIREPRPSRPRISGWSIVGAWSVIATIALEAWLIDYVNVYVILIVVALTAGAVGRAIGAYNETLRQFHIDDIRWQLYNAERWVESTEQSLRQGQPAIDREDPAAWVAEHEGFRTSAERTVAELRARLSKLVDQQRGGNIAI